MYKCKFCGSVIPDYASFCGQCGRTPDKAMETRTMVSGLHMPDVQDAKTVTIASLPGNSTPDWAYNQQTFYTDTPTISLSQDEEEEERRRRAAILGMGVPLIGGLAVEGQLDAANIPMVQGTPQIGGVPTVQGTPQSSAGSIGQGLYSSPTIMAPQLPYSTPVFPLPATTTALHHPHDPHHTNHPHTPHHEPHGCGLVFIIAAISIPILIILSFLGLGLTVLAPGLSLSGSTNVVQGGTLTLHGTHFIPGSSVTLTLDDTIPLYFSSRNLPAQSAFTKNAAMQILSTDTQQAMQLLLSNNTVSVGGDGTFTITLTANPYWAIGEHTIKASETLTHRSADLVFTIYLTGTTPTPATTGTPSASPSANVTPSPTTTLTPTATTTLPGLSCVNPSSLSLGPVSQGYNQPVSAPVTLCTTGTGTVNWTATWDQNAAPWLQLDHTSGQISAPGQAQVNVSALASNLAPGSYSVTLTFTSQPDNTTKSLPISLTVQAGCATANPNRLSYNGVASVSDPAAQSVIITNCGPLGTWSASTQTNTGANWLFVSPTANTLNAGATNNVTFTASNLKAQLAAGTYTGSVTFKIGSGTFIVNVTLTVMPAPTLSGTPTLIPVNRQCKPDQAGSLWTCSVLLTNNSNAVSLNWSATSGINGINFSPSSGTLPPGINNSVQISIPQSDCTTIGKGILTFTGPANTVSVEWYCSAG
jgi:Viral BACON domain